MSSNIDNSDLYRELLDSIAHLSLDRIMSAQMREAAGRGESGKIQVKAGTTFHSFGQGYVAKAHDILHRSGIAKRNPDYDQIQHSSYRMLFDGADAAAKVVEQASCGDRQLPPIDDVVEAWISIACAHHGEVPDSRCEFEINADVKLVMVELAKAGYATQYKGQFVWTNMIGPAMQANYLWNEKNQCNAEVHANEEIMELRTAAESVPEFIRAAVLRDGVSVSYVALSTFWDGEAWISLADWNGRTELSGGIERAERFVELLRGSSSQPKGREHLIPSLSRLFSAQILNDDELDAMERGKNWIKKLREENNK